MKRITLHFLALSLFLLLGFFGDLLQAQSAEHSLEIEQQIDELFSDYNDPQKPGASVAVIKDGKLIYTKGYGSANLEYGIPISPKTVFHVASLSKQFTAFAILLLEEKGLLSLDDDVRKYIPEVPDFGKTITLKHLASHSSGLRDQWDLLIMAGWRLDDVITQEHIFKLVKKQKELNFNPGDENLYSNTGFTLLAEVVARVAGTSYAQFTKEQIFDPLGMNNTQFYNDHEKIVKNRAYSYKKLDGRYKKSVLSYATVGPTSLFTTAEDFAKWAANFENPKVGSKAIIEKLNTPPELNDGKKGSGFALGQFRGTYKGLNVMVHSGSDAGYKAYFGRVPDHNLSVVVLGNISSMNPINETFGIINLYLSEYFESEESGSKRGVFVHDPNIFIKLKKAQLQKFEGDYWEPVEAYKRKIYLKNDTLMYYRSEGNETKLLPISDNEFKMIGDSEDVSVIFNQNAKNEPRMQLFINDRPPINYLAFTEVDRFQEYAGTFYSEELSTNYTLMPSVDGLIAKHSRLSDIPFRPVQKDFFISDNKKFKSLVFERNKDGEITGMKVSNFRARDMYFEKR